ncbi:Trypanosomal VSG domain containing protein [Trypanosoma brucei equiperdum]|uniref:Trypanosomal VSG domain containing protein n=1 Tax=Trypanosoma brucei equiperdum TaxID=630700 RepID=A0A3L6L590_9TRYP|nr:Trypanosomal VSG domain containing protein [Trypanosoma brucei equiperdum]
MYAIKIFVISLLLAFHTATSGASDFLNEDEFVALCLMIKVTKNALRRIKEAREVTKDATRIGARCLQVAGLGILNKICENTDDETCGRRRAFWDAAKDLVNRRHGGVSMRGADSEAEDEEEEGSESADPEESDWEETDEEESHSKEEDRKSHSHEEKQKIHPKEEDQKPHSKEEVQEEAHREETISTSTRLDHRTLEKVQQIAGTAAQVYVDITKTPWVSHSGDLERKIYQALYGVPREPEEIREGTASRDGVCRQKATRSAVNNPPATLSRDLLCMCATDVESRGKTKLCCQNCVAGPNLAVWKPNRDSWERWNYLRAQCAVVRDLQIGFKEMVKKFTHKFGHRHDNSIGTELYMGFTTRYRMWPLGLFHKPVPGPGVVYVLMGDRRGGEDVPWVRLLEQVTKEMGGLPLGVGEEKQYAETLEKLDSELKQLFPAE